ncbi:MAG: hypothetical protein ACAH95_16910 [Fimbriimonas sp.]
MPLRQTLLLVEQGSREEPLAVKAVLGCGVPCEVEVIRHDGHSISDLLAPDGISPQLIILEISGPAGRAIPILRELRSHDRTRHMPVVMLCPEQPQAQIRECLAEGADHYMEKSTEPATYIQHVSLIARSWLALDKRPEQYLPTRPPEAFDGEN